MRWQSRLRAARCGRFRDTSTAPTCHRAARASLCAAQTLSRCRRGHESAPPLPPRLRSSPPTLPAHTPRSCLPGGPPCGDRAAPPALHPQDDFGQAAAPRLPRGLPPAHFGGRGRRRGRRGRRRRRRQSPAQAPSRQRRPCLAGRASGTAASARRCWRRPSGRLWGRCSCGGTRHRRVGARHRRGRRGAAAVCGAVQRLRPYGGGGGAAG